MMSSLMSLVAFIQEQKLQHLKLREIVQHLIVLQRPLPSSFLLVAIHARNGRRVM